MKRAIRFATGIAVLFAMVFFYGFAAQSNALADDGTPPPATETAAADVTPAPEDATAEPADETPVPEDGTAPEDATAPAAEETASPADDTPMPPSSGASMDKKDISSDYSNAKVATTTSNVKTSATVYTKTFNSNVLVYPGATLTVGANAKVVINGDLAIAGAVVISSGSLTVNGDIVDYGKLTVKGTAKVYVNKAPVVNSGYYGGNLVITDIIDLGASMTVSGSASITVSYATDGGFFIQDGAKFVMNSSTAKITVNNRAYFGGLSTKGALTAGTIEIINGGFRQDDAYSDYSFCPAAAFNVTFKGTNSTQRIVYFDTPAYSYFTNFATSGLTYMADSVISINKSLSSNYTFNANNATVCIQGNLNKKTCVITARQVVPTEGAPLLIGSGTLMVNGTLNLWSSSRLTMSDSAGIVNVKGGLYSYCDYTSLLSSGTININGFFTADIGSEFKPGDGLYVIILGTNSLIQHNGDPANCYFTNIKLAVGATLHPNSVISMKKDLSANCSWDIPNLYYRGNLNGHTLRNGGNLTIPSGTALTTGNGTLRVTGNLAVQGDLLMSNADGKVIVSGNFTASSAAASTALSNGTLTIGGNFTQSGNASSFAATGEHTTILNGSGAQTISFGSASSKFAHLVVLNDAIDATAISSSQYGDLIVSGLTLSGVNVSAGAIKSSSDPAYDYLVLLPEGTDSVTITPTFLDRYAGSAYFTETSAGTAHIEAITANGVTPGANVTKSLVAHAYNDLASKTYTFKIEILSAKLGGLGALPAGSATDNSGDPIAVDLPATAASFTFAPQPENPDATLTIGDTALATATVALGYGETKSYTVHVTAQDGTTKQDYHVQFTRHKPVSGITVSAGTMTFNAATSNYDLYVPVTTASVVVTAVRNAADCSDLKINGSAQTDDKLTLAPAAGGAATATVAAMDAGGKSTTTYTVTVHRVAALSGITLSTGRLSPAFSPATLAYSVYLPYNAASVKVTPVKTSGQTMKINGAAVSYVTLSPAAGGGATATVSCTGFGITQTYTVRVYRVMPVSKIALSSGALTPAFSAGAYKYSVSVPATAASVTVSVWKTATLTSMTINGKAATFVSGVAAVKLAPAVGGSASAVIAATAVDGKVYTYTVTVKRASLLTGITTSAGRLTPVFSPTTPAYTVSNVPAMTAQVKISVVKAKTGVKSVTINGKSATSATITPPVGGSATATIVATASDGRTKVTYKVVVQRNGLLSGIRLSSGALSPAFTLNNASYTVNVPADTGSVTVTPVKSSYAKTIAINNRVQASVVLKPPAGGSATATIVVTGTDGKTKQTYTVKVVRHAPLKGIAVAGGALSPAFSPTVHAYTVTLPAATASATITPQLNAGCSYKINGRAANTPYTATLDAGESETVTVTATGADRATTLTYTVTVKRAASLESITADAGHALSPSFDRGTTAYTITANPGDTVTVSASASDSVSVTMNGEARASLDVPCTGTSPATVQIVCTPANGLPAVTYTVTVDWGA